MTGMGDTLTPSDLHVIQIAVDAVSDRLSALTLVAVPVQHIGFGVVPVRERSGLRVAPRHLWVDQLVNIETSPFPVPPGRRS